MPFTVSGEVRRDAFALEVDLSVADGSVVALLGPNGAGKSTLLSVLAGLVPLTRGTVRLGDRLLDDAGSGRFVLPPDRDLGVMFQDHRLFGHLDAAGNVAFGPRARGVTRTAARRIALDWLDRVGLSQFADRRPAELSGGQAQRVALARALAVAPAALLLDEPLAALDAATRLEVQTVLRAHLDSFAGPTVMITHDPLDALLLADRLVVLEDGRVRQDASPAEVAARPATDYVARLIGVTLLAGTVRAGTMAVTGGGTLAVTGADAGRALAAVRPSAVSVHRERPVGASARNVWSGEVRSLARLADRVRLEVTGPPDVLVDVTPAAVADLDLAAGRAVWLSLKATDVETYPA